MLLQTLVDVQLNSTVAKTSSTSSVSCRWTILRHRLKKESNKDRNRSWENLSRATPPTGCTFSTACSASWTCWMARRPSDTARRPGTAHPWASGGRASADLWQWCARQRRPACTGVGRYRWAISSVSSLWRCPEPNRASPLRRCSSPGTRMAIHKIKPSISLQKCAAIDWRFHHLVQVNKDVVTTAHLYFTFLTQLGLTSIHFYFSSATQLNSPMPPFILSFLGRQTVVQQSSKIGMNK